MPRVSDEYRERQRSRVLAAAREQFALNGFRATTMPDIIRAAGMSPGGVYRYFAGKDEIVAEIADAVVQWYARTVAEVLTGGQDWAGALRLLLHRLAEQEDTFGRLALTVWGEAQRDPDMAVLAGRELRALRAQVAGLVQHAGPPDPGSPDPEARAQVVFSILAGFILQRRIAQDVDVDRYADAAIRLLTPSPAGAARRRVRPPSPTAH